MPHSRPGRRFLGHPAGLGFLCLTEAWERFSFYGMQTLLVLYMANALLRPGRIEGIWGMGLAQNIAGADGGAALASRIFGFYAASVYLTPILGGFIADRWLGRRRTVFAGGCVMALGHVLMVFDETFLVALLCLVLGCGLFKGNIAAQVGALYHPDDPRRADAFQLFYLGINAGVIAAPLIIGTLGETVGWHWGFGAAAAGMVAALAIFRAGRGALPEDVPSGGVRDRPPLALPAEKSSVALLAAFLPALAIAIIPNNQIFNAYLLWADRRFDLALAGHRFPTSWLVTLDSVVSVSFLAGVALFYRWWKARFTEPDDWTKLLIGSAFSFAGTLCLVAAAQTPADQPIALGWPVLFHVLNSIGFAHMLPVSLALFTRLAPARLRATAIGIYYLAFFAGNLLVGRIGALIDILAADRFWLLHSACAASAGLLFWLLRTAARRDGAIPD
jgi:POT family proton-dependent oligopeptide transporter